MICLNVPTVMDGSVHFSTPFCYIKDKPGFTSFSSSLIIVSSGEKSRAGFSNPYKPLAERKLPLLVTAGRRLCAALLFVIVANSQPSYSQDGFFIGGCVPRLSSSPLLFFVKIDKKSFQAYACYDNIVLLSLFQCDVPVNRRKEGRMSEFLKSVSAYEASRDEAFESTEPIDDSFLSRKSIPVHFWTTVAGTVILGAAICYAIAKGVPAEGNTVSAAAAPVKSSLNIRRDLEAEQVNRLFNGRSQ